MAKFVIKVTRALDVVELNKHLPFLRRMSVADKEALGGEPWEDDDAVAYSETIMENYFLAEGISLVWNEEARIIRFWLAYEVFLSD